MVQLRVGKKTLNIVAIIATKAAIGRSLCFVAEVITIVPLYFNKPDHVHPYDQRIAKLSKFYT